MYSYLATKNFQITIVFAITITIEFSKTNDFTMQKWTEPLICVLFLYSETTIAQLVPWQYLFCCWLC